MAEIRHLENRHDVIFSAEGGPIWIKFRRLVQIHMSTDVVEIETRCRIPIWRTFGRIQWHVIPAEPPATLQGAATWRTQCHGSRDTCHIAGCCHRANSMACHPRATYHIAGCCHLVKFTVTIRATCHIAGCSHLAKSMSWSCHIAGCKNSIRHIKNRYSPYVIFLFLMQFRLWRVAAFISSPMYIHLFDVNADSYKLSFL